jgi:hypothetical protein
MKRSLFISLQIAILFLISGCVDYGVFYIYIVENKLHQPIKVIFEVPHYTQATDTIGALKSQEIFKNSSLCGKKYTPQKEELPFNTIEIYYRDTVKIKMNFKNEDLWSFSSKEYEGKYVLLIDTTLLK